MAIEKGFTYNPETGKVFGIKGKEIICKRLDYIILQITFNGKKYVLNAHQFAWYWVNKECVIEIDHRNGVKVDNKISNLRSITHQKNNWNRVNAKGYYYNKKYKKYHASIGFNGKIIHLGSFEKEEEARAVYLDAKKKYHII